MDIEEILDMVKRANVKKIDDTDEVLSKLVNELADLTTAVAFLTMVKRVVEGQLHAYISKTTPHYILDMVDREIVHL